MKTLLITALLLASAGVARADTIWKYQGNSMSDPAVGTLDDAAKAFVPTPNPCGCAISGSLTLSDAGIPTLWNFTAGAVTLTSLNSSIQLNDMAWPGNPNLFAGWDLTLQGAGAYLFSGFEGSHFDATDSVLVGGEFYQYVQGEHGVWSEPVSSPEPSTLALLALGLVAFARFRR